MGNDIDSRISTSCNVHEVSSYNSTRIINYATFFFIEDLHYAVNQTAHGFNLFSILLGMAMAFRPNGIVLNGVLLRSETTLGNLNFYKGVEGFLESFPQAIYQTSILFRTAGRIGKKFFKMSLYLFIIISNC